MGVHKLNHYLMSVQLALTNLLQAFYNLMSVQNI